MPAMHEPTFEERLPGIRERAERFPGSIFIKTQRELSQTFFDRATLLEYVDVLLMQQEEETPVATKLYLMVTHTKYESDFHAYTKEADAIHAAAEFTRENWGDGYLYNHALPQKPPADDRKVIELGEENPDDLWYASVVEVDLD